MHLNIINKNLIYSIVFVLFCAVLSGLSFLWYTKHQTSLLNNIKLNSSQAVSQLTNINNLFKNHLNYLQSLENKHEIHTNYDKITQLVFSTQKIINQNIIKKSDISIKGEKYVFAIIILSYLMILFIMFLTDYKNIQPLRQTIDGLTGSTQQVNNASLNVSSVSQAVAERTFQQAELLEQIISILKQVASMICKNAENVDKADSLMNAIIKTSRETTHFMKKLSKFMGTMTSASQKTSKIVKTIDDVAFKTKLLALNAAIEAAKVGEAGNAFSVVANEVRSLASQVTKASNEISDLLNNMTLQIIDGMEKFNETDHVFNQVSNNVSSINKIINIISKVSIEQSKNINNAYTFIDKIKDITQKNVKEAEKSASASLEMSAQAEQLKFFVEDLRFEAFAKTKKEKPIQRSIVTKKLAKGEYLIRQGEYSQEAYVIEEGVFDIFQNQNPNQIVATLTKGEIVGEIALVKNIKRTANVVAKTDAKVIVLNQKDVMEVLQKQKMLSQSVASMIKRRLEELL